jgi:hypothetical protein
VVNLLLDKALRWNRERLTMVKHRFFLAAAKEHQAVVELLIDRGANAQAKENYNRTAILRR